MTVSARRPPPVVLTAAEGRKLLATPPAKRGRAPRRKLSPLEQEAARAKREKWQALFAHQLRSRRVDGWQQELRFDTAEQARARGDVKGARLWRFDFAWPALRIAVEIHGGTHSGGRHSRGAGMAADFAKHNAATLAGWRVLYGDGDAVRSGELVATVCALLGRG